MKLSLVTPSKKLITDMDVEEVTIPTAMGELNILPGHAPLMSILETGIMTYKAAGQGDPKVVALSWGYLEVSKDTVTVLAETAETAETIDLARVAEARQKAEKALATADLEQSQFRKYQLKLDRALIRQQVAEKHNQTEH